MNPLLIAGKLLLYLGVMGVVGGVAARHLFKVGLPRLRFLLLSLLLLTLGAGLGVYAVLVELDMLNFTDTLDYLTRVAAGRAVLTLGLGSCLLLAAHLSRFSRLTELGAALLTLWGLAGVGHGAVHGEFVRFLHVLHAGAMSVWVAGVLTLNLTAGEKGQAMRRFSLVALACVLTLAGTGLLLTINHAGGVLDLPRSDYGRFLLFKLNLFSLALLLALLIRSRLAGSRLILALRLDALLMLGILLLTATLSNTIPPSHMIH